LTKPSQNRGVLGHFMVSIHRKILITLAKLETYDNILLQMLKISSLNAAELARLRPFNQVFVLTV